MGGWLLLREHDPGRPQFFIRHHVEDGWQEDRQVPVFGIKSTRIVILAQESLKIVPAIVGQLVSLTGDDKAVDACEQLVL
jgi:hypothetical protein